MKDFSAERSKFSVGARGMKGAPMGKSVFRLLRSAHPDISNLNHQPPQKDYGNERSQSKQAGPFGGFLK